METLRPNKKRAKIAIVLIWIILGMEILSLGSSYLTYDLIQDVSNGSMITQEKADANDMRELVIGIVFTALNIVSAVTFIMWFRRAYYNLHLKVEGLSFTEGWAAGCWFVPIVNLYRPYQIMDELYKDTKNVLANNGTDQGHFLSTKYLGFWWTLWIVNGIIGQFVFRYSRHAETLDELNTLTTASMIGNILGIPLALITIKIIKDYSAIEPLLDEETSISGGSGNIGGDIDLIDG